MKISVLVDNFAGGGFQAEHGLSYLIEHNNTTILLDTGHSDMFLKNAQKLGVDLNLVVNTIVLSHGHWDHGNGLRYLNGKKLLTHPSAFIKRYRKSNHTYIGLALSKEETEKNFDLHTTTGPYEIGEGFIFLGEIPRSNDFEAQATPFVKEDGTLDFVPDDSALAIVKENELVIVSGCAHAGICNITEYAKAVTGINKVRAVFGGLHLKQEDHQTKQTIQYLKNQKVDRIYPSHCTKLPALAAFYREFGIHQVQTGMIINI